MLLSRVKTMTPEHRAKISAALKGRPKDPEVVARMAATNRGKRHSPEWSAHISAGLCGRAGHKQSLEARTAISEALSNRPKSPEHCAALREAMARPETKARRRAASLGNSYVLKASVKGECVYCTCHLATQHDHVIPRGRPGWEAPDNVVLACLECNDSKNNRTPDEWFAAMEVV